MTLQAAIKQDLVNSIVAKTGCTAERAANEIKAAAATAKATGLTIAEVLVVVGLV
jgi:hypothetical protein